MNDQKNMILAIVLSAIVLFGWNYFFGIPQMQKQREQQAQQQSQQTTAPTPSTTPGTAPSTTPGSAPAPAQPGAPQTSAPGAAAGQVLTREAVLVAGPRIAIDTPALKGSIALKGARIDDLALVQYRETVDPKSPAIVLLAPSGTPHPFYAEFGWVAGAGTNAKVPTPDTVWRQDGNGTLGVGNPITLVWDNTEAWNFAAPSRSTTNTSSPRATRSSTRARAPSRCCPMR
jgi:YidC/Oxa1 family membrane protein insertase